MNEKHIEMLNRITYYLLGLTILFGTFGSLFNIIIFTSKQFRYNSCAFYLLCSTLFDLFYLLISGITRLISENNPHLFFSESILYCKIRTYLVILIPCLATYFLTLASVDRCLSTSASKKWRDYSHINLAWRIALFTILFLILSTSHVLFFFKLRQNPIEISFYKYKCIPDDGIYQIIFCICLLTTSPFLLYMIMLICTIITLIRIRKSRSRLKYLYNNSRIGNRIHNSIDRHLIRILLFQVGLGMILTFSRCGFLVYTYWTNDIQRNLTQTNLYLFVDKVSLIIYYINFAKSFPVNILTTSLFRHVVNQRLHFIIRSFYH